MDSGTKENPLPRIDLVRIVWPDFTMYPQIKRGIRKKNPKEYWQIKELQKIWDNTFESKMKPYRVGTFKDWEDGGYYSRPLYLYEGKYYGSY